MAKGEKFELPGHIILTEEELIGLALCVFLDVIEYILRILLLPVVGDIFDVAGVASCIYLFRWIGVLTLLEFVPGVDILPTYIITWLIWYFMRKWEEWRKSEKFR
jgi:hypothetical protein